MDLRIIPKKISIPLVILILQLFLFINAPKIYGSGYQNAQTLLITYMFMMVSVAVFTGTRPDMVKGQRNPLNFFIFFIASTIIFITLPALTGLKLFATLGIASAVQYGIIQSFVVAYTEESVFRGLLTSFGLGDIPSNILFALFHFAVSGGNWFFMLFAFGAGMLFSFVRDRYGLYASIGIHSAFNLKALGLLDQLIRGTL